MGKQSKKRINASGAASAAGAAAAAGFTNPIQSDVQILNPSQSRKHDAGASGSKAKSGSPHCEKSAIIFPFTNRMMLKYAYGIFEQYIHRPKLKGSVMWGPSVE